MGKFFENHYLPPMRYFLAILSCCLMLFANSQKKNNEYILVYDGDWKPCKPDSAEYLAFVQKLNDTAWQWNYYNYRGPALVVETYKDEDATIANGYFGYFNKKSKN